MKLKLTTLVLALFLLALSIPAFAQLNDGDTLYIKPFIDPAAPWPDTIRVDVMMSLNSYLGGLSLGFRPLLNGLPTTDIEVVGYDTTGSVLPGAFPGNWIPPAFNSSLNAILLGWISFSPPANPNSPKGKLATLKFVVRNPSIPAGTKFSVDTVFVPPAGFPRMSIGPTPTTTTDTPAPYDGRGGQHIVLPVHEYDTPVLPSAFSLSQNVPNPFNPTTAIDFAIPRAAHVKIEVFNILGQKVRTLVDEDLMAGRKRVEWDGADDRGVGVATGVYLYRMTAGDFAETKKMLMMK